MKVFLNKLNSRIDNLVNALKEADSKIAKSPDQETMLNEIKERQKLNEGSIADAFRDKVGSQQQ